MNSNHSFQFNRKFKFKGRIPASKSILNRLLILQSFAPELRIAGESQADDVRKMRSALAALGRGEPADCGAAGTTLRFLALRAARQPGTHHLTGTLRLFQRPQAELVRLLEQLGCTVELGPQRLTVRGAGWLPKGDELFIDRSISSQFASALLLSAWDLPIDLRLRFEGPTVSESYFSMTKELVRSMGMRFLDETTEGLTIAAGSRIQKAECTAEPDVSSAFAVCALAVAAGGCAEVEGWPESSLQPDHVFPEILRAMGVQVDVIIESGERVLRVERLQGSVLRPIERNLCDSPDLFPVLSVLCALADGKSFLFGAPHLAYKESSRIDKSSELIRLMGRDCRPRDGGLEIDGWAAIDGAHQKCGLQHPDKESHNSSGAPDSTGFANANGSLGRVDSSGSSDMSQNDLQAESKLARQRSTVATFSTDHDHRLAMAAAVANVAGHSIEILDPHVVNKSFPGFWDIVRASGVTV